MSKDKPRNLAASVRHKLLDLARARKEDFQLVLMRYGLERLLYRLSLSAYAGEFVLKGAMLFQLWTDQPHRPTRDLDLLGQGEPDLERFAQLFRELCRLEAGDDGLEFRPDTVHGEHIKEDQAYAGLRIQLDAYLGHARIPIQIDIGFGDAITPAPARIAYPSLLDLPAPTLRAYPQVTVVAEKYHAMVVLGMANSRMKDFYDLWVLARDFTFEGSTLSRAMHATFQRRKTALPAATPLALSPEFCQDRAKSVQWQAFLRKSRLADGIQLAEVAVMLRDFLLPPTQALNAGEKFALTWPAAGPWGR